MKSVLITGASGGIGGAAVERFARQGWRVFAGVRRNGDGPEAGPAVTPLVVDVTDEEAVREAADRIERETGDQGLQAVVNNAGLIVSGPLELVPGSDLRQQFEVNVVGAVTVVRAMLPALRRGGGRILNISAPSARVAIPFMGPIGASKAALESMSDALRIELAPWSIPVIVISPTATDTRIFAKADARAAEARSLAEPARGELYDRQIDSVAAANAGLRREAPDAIAKVIVRAADSARPRRRYVAGRGVRAIEMLAGLPGAVRDRLLAGALGLNRAADREDQSTGSR